MSAQSIDTERLTQRLLNSYCHWLGTELIERSGSPGKQADNLFHAPRVVVAHGTQADPILCYGNKMALELWEMDSASFCTTPSRMTAEPVHRDERARLLDRTTLNGFVDDYRGIRITRTGRRFLIDRAIVWNLLDEHGVYCGQAATFDTWTWVNDAAAPASESPK